MKCYPTTNININQHCRLPPCLMLWITDDNNKTFSNRKKNPGTAWPDGSDLGSLTGYNQDVCWDKTRRRLKNPLPSRSHGGGPWFHRGC